MKSLIADYTRLLRLPGLGGLSIAPVFGAISTLEGVIDIIDLFLIFLIGAFSAIYGFVLNDITDVEVDRLSKELSNRPLVKGTISKKIAMLICLFCFIATFAVIFAFFSSSTFLYYGLICILLAALFGSIYNVYGKRFVGSDFFVALSEALLVLFGGYIVLQEGALSIFTWIIFILTFDQLVFMNAVSGGIKDADHDYLKGVKNIALKLGVKVDKNKNLVIPYSFRIFGFSFRALSAILVFIPLILFKAEYSIWQIILLILVIIAVFYLSARLLSLKKFDRTKIRKLISQQTFLRYFLVPIMLFQFIGLEYTILLIAFPFLWYLVFTPLTGGKIFQPGI